MRDLLKRPTDCVARRTTYAPSSSPFAFGLFKRSLQILAIFALSGCASFSEFFSETPVAETLSFKEKSPRYSENPQMGVPSNRQYRRMTKNRMEEESELHSQAGSMWVNEGQGSYLFVQNKTRREGDILNVKLEGAALRQVETKVGVIKKLLKQLEEQQQQSEIKTQNMAESAPNGGAVTPPPARAPAGEDKKKDDKEDLSDVQNISTRIVERLPDGNYRVKGQQPFMIGKREYKVIVTGLIRPEDYNDEGVPSSKLLDPQFDVVSLRRKQGNETNTL